MIHYSTTKHERVDLNRFFLLNYRTKIKENGDLYFITVQCDADHRFALVSDSV